MIDLHSHVVPLGLPARPEGDRWPAIASADGGPLLVAGGRVVRRLAPIVYDGAARVADLTAQQVSRQLVSPLPELFSYWADPEPAADYCRAVNAGVAEMVQDGDGRLVGLGMVPLQDVEATVAMLAELRDLGLRGVELGSNVRGQLASGPDFLLVYQECRRLGMAVFLHANRPPYGQDLPAGRAGAAATFASEIGMCTAALVLNGILERCPGLPVLVSHGGGSVIGSLARIESVWATDPALRAALPAAPADYLRRLHFDSLVFSRANLDLLVATVGKDRVVLGSDYPFMNPQVAAGLPRDVADDLADTIGRTNGESFLAGLTPPMNWRTP